MSSAYNNNSEFTACGMSFTYKRKSNGPIEKAKKMIESCVLLESDEGYKEAKKLLAERFGNKFKVTNSWIRKVSDGPAIKV